MEQDISRLDTAALFDAALPVGLLLCGVEPGFPVLNANAAFAALLGYESREALLSACGGLLSGLLAPEEDAAAMLALARALNPGEARVYSYRMLSRTGSVWVRETCMRLGWQGREALLCFCADVSEYMRMRDELALSAHKLHTLMNTVPGGIAEFEHRFDGSSSTVFLGSGMFALTGYSREEYLALTAGDTTALVHPDDRPALSAQIARLMAEGVMIDCRYRLNTKSGASRWVQLRGAELYRTETKVGVGVVLMDVQRLREAEERLRVSEEQYRVAMEDSDRLVARYDARRGVYIHNDKFLLAQGFGREIEDVPEVFIARRLVLAESAESCRDFYRRIREGGENCESAAEMATPRGPRWFKARAILFDESGARLEQTIITYSDVTEQRERELVYKKWQQSLEGRRPESYTMFRCNLSRDAALDSVEGSLLSFEFSPEAHTFNSRTLDYAERRVFLTDRERYIAFVDSDALLSGYYRGHRAGSFEYRELAAALRGAGGVPRLQRRAGLPDVRGH